jgi:hypothetical protein
MAKGGGNHERTCCERGNPALIDAQVASAPRQMR